MPTPVSFSKKQSMAAAKKAEDVVAIDHILRRSTSTMGSSMILQVTWLLFVLAVVCFHALMEEASDGNYVESSVTYLKGSSTTRWETEEVEAIMPMLDCNGVKVDANTAEAESTKEDTEVESNEKEAHITPTNKEVVPAKEEEVVPASKEEVQKVVLPATKSEISCDPSNPTRILVTGVNGMIGSHLARVLVDKPCYEVYGMVRPRSNLDTLTGILNNLKLVMADINDGPRIRTILQEIKPHYVYHMAAQAINGISYRVAQLTIDTNIQGTLHLLEGVLELEKPYPTILLAGSSTEYGQTADLWDQPLTEEAPMVPVSPYGVSKVAMEHLGRQYYLSYGIPVITARFFIQIGVGGTDSLAIHEFCKQIAMAELGLLEPIIQHGNLESRRDMMDARDSAPVVVQLAETGVAGEAYNIASGQSHSIQELLDMATGMAKIPVQKEVDKARYRLYDEKDLVADISKLQKLTGWSPQHDLKDSVESILDYWRRKIQYLYVENKDPSSTGSGAESANQAQQVEDSSSSGPM